MPRTDVVILRGPYRGRHGHIFGALTSCHPLVTTTRVYFGRFSVPSVAIRFEDLAPAAGAAPAQLELVLKKTKARRRRDAGDGPGDRLALI